MEDRATNAGPCSFLRPGKQLSPHGNGLIPALGLTPGRLGSQDETPKAKRFFPGGRRCTEVAVLTGCRHLLCALQACPLFQLLCLHQGEPGSGQQVLTPESLRPDPESGSVQSPIARGLFLVSFSCLLGGDGPEPQKP